jgi:hypothetical protein
MDQVTTKNLVKVATWSEVPDHMPVGATVEGIDLDVTDRDMLDPELS